MKNILSALLAFIIIRLYYGIFVIRKNKKYNPNKPVSEVKILVKKYNIDMNKINYTNLLKTISLINSLDIALVIFWVSFIKRLNVQCLVAIVLIIPVIFISYEIFGNYLKQKGLIKNENNKRNRK